MKAITLEISAKRKPSIRHFVSRRWTWFERWR